MGKKQKQATLVLPNYPYRNRFTPEQTDEALARKDLLVELMMDAVGPDGTVINIPVDLLHILGFHLAFAGADAHTDHRQLIEARILPNEANDNEYGLRFEDMRIWKPRGDFHDEPPADESQQEANLLAAQLRRKDPVVRAALAKIFADEFGAQAARDTVDDREKAENVILETREMRDKYMKDG